ncbi:YihY/virulence factor BrkB family protein [Bacillus sp. AGMB 02131]|uniref:YihY/virulence factor BrkB family protein n=2 Tax=Peribacillus faecalis TaxID=2772559 RepID=A0A927CVW7_9BACI|nr:YihY/virulence factor BrkB family protein [Peribacillus faecalis]
MLFKRTMEHDVSGMAAQLAFFFLLSVFPLLIFLFTLVPYLPITEDYIITYLSEYVPTESMAIITSQLDRIMTSSRTLLSVGIIGTLWTASNALNGITKAFNVAYDIVNTRKYFFTRLISMALTIGMIFVFLLVLLLPVFGKQIAIYIFSHIGINQAFLDVWDAIRWVLSTLVLFIMFLILYRVFPSVKMKQRLVLPGALFATFGWTIGSIGFSYYVNNFGHYSNTYGSLGGIIILMLWFYILAFVIILGSEINAMGSRVD